MSKKATSTRMSSVSRSSQQWRSRRVLVGLGCVGTLVLVGCGERVPTSQIAADAGVGSSLSTQSGIGGTSGTGTSTSGGSTSGGSTSGGSTSGGSTSGGSTSGGSTSGGSTSGGSTSGGSTSGGSTSGKSSSGTSTSGASTSGKSSSGSSSTAATGSPIRLGQVGIASGPIGSSFNGAPIAARVWAAWTNAHGGINGHPIQIFTADTGGDPATALSETQKMVQSDHVVAFVGDQLPLEFASVIPYVTKANIPLVGGDVVHPGWNTSPDAFAQGPGAITTGKAEMALMAKTGKKKLAFAYCIEASVCTGVYDNAIKSGAAKADGLDVVYTTKISIASPDYTAQCLSGKQAGAQLYFVGGDADTVERFADSCARQNYHPIFAAYTLAITAALTSDSNLNGMLGSQNTFPFPLNSPVTSDFRAAFAQYAPSQALSGATASVWTAGELLRTALQNIHLTPSQTVTGALIKKGLYTIKHNNLGGLTAPLTFTPGQASPQLSCYFAVQIEGGKFVAPDGDKCLPLS